MIAPFHVDQYVLWGNVLQFAMLYASFLCWGDHGPYCPIKWETL